MLCDSHKHGPYRDDEIKKLLVFENLKIKAIIGARVLIIFIYIIVHYFLVLINQ